MGINMGILRLLPFASASVLAGGVAVNTVGKDSLSNTDLPAIIQEREKEKVDETFIRDELNIEVKPIPTSIVAIPKETAEKSQNTRSGSGSSGGRFLTGSLQGYHGIRGGDGQCHIYMIKVWSDTGSSLEITDYVEYTNKEEVLSKSIPSLSNKILCSSDRYFYVWKNSFGDWQVRVGSKAPYKK